MIVESPTKIERLIQSNALRLHYGERHYTLEAEFLRVHSPSAEVRQHGKPIVVAGQRQVKLEAVEPIGHYGIKLIFDDGHDTGIYTWPYLKSLAENQAQLWLDYLEKLSNQGKSRDPGVQVVEIQPPPGGWTTKH